MEGRNWFSEMLSVVEVKQNPTSLAGNGQIFHYIGEIFADTESPANYCRHWVVLRYNYTSASWTTLEWPNIVLPKAFTCTATSIHAGQKKITVCRFVFPVGKSSNFSFPKPAMLDCVWVLDPVFLSSLEGIPHQTVILSQFRVIWSHHYNLTESWTVIRSFPVSWLKTMRKGLCVFPEVTDSLAHMYLYCNLPLFIIALGLVIFVSAEALCHAVRSISFQRPLATAWAKVKKWMVGRLLFFHFGIRPISGANLLWVSGKG